MSKDIEVERLREDIPSIVVRDMLRVALAPSSEMNLVQCADCLAWFNGNGNHTCEKQVKANRRRAAIT